MRIKYIDHSGFIIEENSTVIMIDCCGLSKDSAIVKDYHGKSMYILASHKHSDHFDPKIFSFEEFGDGKSKFILSEDIRSKGKVSNSFLMAKGDEYKDDHVKIKVYGSTDEGISFYIETGGFRIFHAGDLNNWHWNEEETKEDAAKNEEAFLDELKIIKNDMQFLDIAMFPVDPRLGKDYTRGAEQFLESIKVRLFIPMHFWGKYEALAAFKPIAESKGSDYAEIRKKGDIFILNNKGEASAN